MAEDIEGIEGTKGRKAELEVLLDDRHDVRVMMGDLFVTMKKRKDGHVWLSFDYQEWLRMGEDDITYRLTEKMKILTALPT